MNQEVARWVAKEVHIPVTHVHKVLELLKEGATIPFLARYRKEQTGGLDEVQLGDIQKQATLIRDLIDRKSYILDTIQSQNQLTPELKSRIENCFDPAELEDLYLPYKPKRRTKATVAKEKGLEPLAVRIYRQGPDNPNALAQRYIGQEVPDVEAALQGARDIIAEWISEDEKVRKQLRFAFERGALIETKLIKDKEKEGEKYRDYFSFSESLKHCPSHRLLAMRRAETEGIIRVKISPDESRTFPQLERIAVRGRGPCSDQVATALADAYKRLLLPGIETEFKQSSKLKADQEAIGVFQQNLHQLLMAPPLGEKRILALDPGFRTGCKMVSLNEQGDLIREGVIYPLPPQSQSEAAATMVSNWVLEDDITAIAIGNGTAGRETMSWCTSIGLPKSVEIFMVNEAGASIYSASEAGREEFPSHDLTVRGAVSIGRRLMDPLAELVKIDAKSIGVGQYQHDVDQKLLREGLEETVVSCVHAVGVNLNTASKHLLAYVSGLGPALGAAIIKYRSENGPFMTRADLLQVPRLGAKAYEQCAGFLRIKEGKEILDRTAVHPERYPLVRKMAKDLGVKVQDLIDRDDLRKKIDLTAYVGSEVGLPTLQDILKELDKPGLDPRGEARTFSFANVHKMEDLEPGMRLPGLVTNLTNFGAFVDVGIKQDGLVHISQITHKFIKSPAEVLMVGQEVEVKVVEVDIPRKRISLSML